MGEEETGRKGRERKLASSKAAVPLSNGVSSSAFRHLHTQKDISHLKHSSQQVFKKMRHLKLTQMKILTRDSIKGVPRK